MMNRYSQIVSFTCMIALVLLIALITACDKSEPTPLMVCDKYEKDGRCYVNVWVEVTPEEYIGLDVGDDYELQ